MNQQTTLTLKIVNDQDVLDGFAKEKPLSESQKELIKLIARAAVQEYIREEKATRQEKCQDRILRLPEVEKRVGLRRTSIYKHIKAGHFPKPLKLSSRSVGWKESQITKWLDERVASIQSRDKVDNKALKAL